MNHSELVTTLAPAIQLTKADTDLVLRELYNQIGYALSSGEEVTLLGLGKLKIKTRAARKARNPSTGQVIEIPEKKTVGFVPTTALKDSVQ